MYTWGYLKESALAKLDVQNEDYASDIVSKFHFFANEAMTQICSAVIPKRTFAEFVVVERESDAVDGKIQIGRAASMPVDFISFGDDVNERTYTLYNVSVSEEVHDADMKYIGYNKLLFYKPGIYQISYNARWFDFAIDTLDDDTVIDAPRDVLECIPFYIASQCLQSDNEYKAASMRNEYEMALARIDNTDFKQTKTFVTGGDW